jgi:hypothetical protein
MDPVGSGSYQDILWVLTGSVKFKIEMQIQIRSRSQLILYPPVHDPTQPMFASPNTET